MAPPLFTDQPDPTAPKVPWLLDSRRLLRVFLLVVAGGAILGSAWWGWREWKQRRLVAQARACLEQKDYRGAALHARQVLQRKPKEAEGYRLMAELSELAGFREAIFWRGRVSAHRSATVADHLALASVALRFGEAGVADDALMLVPPASRRSAEFHTLAGILAVDTGNLRLAEFHFASAVQLDPTNDFRRLNLATVRLRSASPSAVEESRAVLGELRRRKGCEASATRALLADALQGARSAEAVALAREVLAHPAAAWQDRLLALTALARFHDRGFSASLSRVQEEAVGRAPEVAQTLSWMVANQLAVDALAWAQKLPPSLRSEEPIPTAMAEVLAANGDWAGLRRLLESREWRGREDLRGAWLARALRELGDSAAARRSWKQAVAAVSARPTEMVLLARLARRWGWMPEAEDLLWRLAASPPYQKWALQVLFAVLQERGDTRGLRRVVEGGLALDPSDMAARNNLALYSLLLRTEMDAAVRNAGTVYRGNPSNAVFASTWAFALHASGKTAEGLRVLESLKPSELRLPSVAAYRGILLAWTGNVALASECLALANAARLLPEERELVEAARRQVIGANTAER
jgi:tetratricopeptide (TPR) repeat protein